MRYIFLILFIFLASCKDNSRISSTYDISLFQCKWQSNSCSKPINNKVFYIDSIQYKNKTPIFEFCKSDSLLNVNLANSTGRKAYYAGTIQHTSNFDASCLLIENSTDVSVNQSKGFIIIRKPNKGGYYLLESLSTGVDQENRLETKFENGYYYIYQASNPHYDIVDSPSLKKRTYCIVSVSENGDPVLLSKIQGEKILKRLF